MTGIDSWMVNIHRVGPPPCSPGTGDLNQDGDVELNDFSIFAIPFATVPTASVPNCIPWALGPAGEENENPYRTARGSVPIGGWQGPQLPPPPHGVALSRTPARTILPVRELADKSLSRTDIARVLGCHRRTVSRMLAAE